MVKSELLKLWRQKELEVGRIITVSEVVEATGLSRETVTNFKSGLTTRYDAPVIAKLCDYFGVEKGQPVPFLVYTDQLAA